MKYYKKSNNKITIILKIVENQKKKKQIKVYNDVNNNIYFIL